MKRYLKIFLLQIVVVVAFLGTLEIAFYVMDYFFRSNLFKDQSVFLMDNSKEYAHVKSFDRRHFCDAIHVNENGHRIMAECLEGFLKKTADLTQQKNIFAMGGSTTEGQDCNSTIRRSDELEKKIVNLKITNYGKAPVASNYDLALLKNNLKHGNIPDYVLWGNWVNELFSYKTNDKYFNAKIILLKSYNTFYKHLWAARLISNNYNEVNSKEFSFIDAANIFYDEDDKTETFLSTQNNSNEDYYSKSLNNYIENIKQLQELSKKYKFEVIIQGFPYIKQFYSRAHPRLDVFFKNWVELIKKHQHEEAIKNNFKYVDVQSCFEEKRRAWATRVYN